jgi:ABC-type phosphate transport system substrate-binding protein
LAARVRESANQPSSFSTIRLFSEAGVKVAGVVLLVLALSVPLDRPSHATEPSVQTESLPRGSWEGLAIIVNSKNPVSNLTLWQLRHIFLGERLWWANGRRVVLAALPPGSAERQTVLRMVYAMNDKDFDKYFLWGMFRGEFVTSPTTLRTPRDVRKFVASTPGAVAYVRVSDLDNSVKVVRINNLRPEDDGYPLRLRVRPSK